MVDLAAPTWWSRPGEKKLSNVPLAIVLIGVLVIILLLYILIKYIKNLPVLNSRHQQLINPFYSNVVCGQVGHAGKWAFKNLPKN